MVAELKQIVSGIALFLLASASGVSLPPSTQDPAYVAKIKAKHAEEAKDLQAPNGWLSLVALAWVQPGDLAVGSSTTSKLKLLHGPTSAFTLHSAGKTVTVAAADASLKFKGKSVKPGQQIDVSEDPADGLTWDTFTANLVNREGRFYLRVRDTASPDLQHFHPLHFYPVNSDFRIVAKYVPYTTPHTLVMATQTGQILKLPAPGYAEFTIAGTTVRLEPFEQYGGSLAFLFRDTTSKTKSYGAGRELFADAPSNGLKSPGTVTLDFNEAFNPPCAYTPFGTCPLPPPGNRLQVALPAGEQRYHD
jgi:uncharacterized protein